MGKKILFLFCFIKTTLFASLLPAPGNFAFALEFLYFEPLLDHNYYAILGDDQGEFQPNGKRLVNALGFHQGYRVEGRYTFCNCVNDLRVRWSYLSARNHENVRVTFFDHLLLFPTEGPADFGIVGASIGGFESKIGFRYRAADAFFSHLFCTNECVKIYAQAGLQYADFNLNKKLNGDAFIPELGQTIEFSFLKNKGFFWGLGPQLGLDFYYNFTYLSRCLRGMVFASVNTQAALLVGHSHVDWSFDFIVNDTVRGELEIRDQNTTRMVPSWKIRAGLNYGFTCCFPFVFEIGYEFLTYIRAVSTLVFNNPDFRGYSENRYSNVDMHGLYVNLSASF